MPATPRQHVHDLIERMPAPQLAAVARLLEVMLDPVSEALAAAPAEDEPISAAERREAARGRKWLASHPGAPLAAVVADIRQANRTPLRQHPARRR